MLKPLKIYGTEIKPGTQTELSLKVAKLPTRTDINIPVFINRAEEEGPVLLLMGGLHGDEINSIEILRRIKEEGHDIPKRGTVITIPLLNIFGFINFSRDVPDGKDVNRSFPGHSRGSLASRMAYHLMKEIIPHIDFGIDFHTGGAARSNYPQIRCEFEDEENLRLAKAFNAPLTIHSKMIPKSFRHAAAEKGKRILVFEGGESLRFDEFSIKEAIEGVRSFMGAVDMHDPFIQERDDPTVLIKERTWLRAEVAGMFRPDLYNGSRVKEGQVIGSVNSPYGDMFVEIKSPFDGYILCTNNNPVVNQGDALLNLGKLQF